jgi:hypothetical protein
MDIPSGAKTQLNFAFFYDGSEALPGSKQLLFNGLLRAI